jgi:hypothetical protein
MIPGQTPLQSYMIKTNKVLTAEAFLKRNIRSTHTHIRPSSQVNDESELNTSLMGENEAN